MRERISRRSFLKAAGLGTVGITVFGLTGCGGGGGGSTGGQGIGDSGNGGNTGTGGNSGTGGDSGNSGNTGTGGGSESGEEKPGQYVSRTVKYFKRQGALGNNKYIRYYSRKIQKEITEVCDGRRRALHGWIESGTQLLSDVKVLDYKTQRFYEYNSAWTRDDNPVDVVEITEHYGISNTTECSLNILSA